MIKKDIKICKDLMLLANKIVCERSNLDIEMKKPTWRNLEKSIVVLNDMQESYLILLEKINEIILRKIN